MGDSNEALFFFFRWLMLPVLKMKERSEAFVKTSGMDYTIIRPGGLSEKSLSGEVAFGMGGKISGFINRKDVARVCVEALTSEKMGRKVLEVVDRASVKETKKAFIVEI